MVIHNLNFNNGGITKVIMNRSHFFNELGYTANIATFDGEQDYPLLEQKLKECGRLHPNSKIINFYDYFLNKNYSETQNLDPIPDAEFKLDEDDYLTQKTYFVSKGFIRYFNNLGVLIKCKYWTDNKLTKVDYYQNNIVSYSKIYKNDRLFQTINYNESGKDILSRFFTPDGFCYFQRSFLDEGQVLHLFLFDRQSKSVIGFNNYRKLHTYFLEQLCTESKKENNIIICDGPGSAEKVANVSANKAKRILTIHSNHFSSPYTIGSPIKEGIQMTLDNVDKVDNIIVLTPSQLNDLKNQFGNNEKFYFIPNTIKEPIDFDKSIYLSHSTKRINIVSRYVAMKHHDHVIEAISKFASKLNNNSLEVNFYGDGTEKTKLKKLVEKLNLTHIVKINDYVVDVDTIFKQADLTIFTSSYEGFGLTIIEAMANKTPVISYDINYGPRDIITHGEDGYLIEYGNITELSNTIFDTLFNESILRKFSENAFIKIHEKFTHTVAKKAWEKIIEK